MELLQFHVLLLSGICSLGCGDEKAGVVSDEVPLAEGVQPRGPQSTYCNRATAAELCRALQIDCPELAINVRASLRHARITPGHG